MAEKVMALYLEDTNIKLLVARGREVEQWASVTLESGLVNDGVIVDEKRVADKVREIFAAIKRTKVNDLFGGKGKIIVGLSGRDSLYRVLSLPAIRDSLLPEAVHRESGRVLPVSLNELYLAYQRIPGKDNEIRVFVAAFPKKTTDVLIRTLRLAGVTPRVLDLAPLALCQSVNEPRSIIADARMDNLNIMIMADRVPQVIRSLSLQSEGKTITENMPIIIEEFSRTVAFYNSSHQQNTIDSNVPVYVSGDLANAPDVWQALVGKLNSQVALLPNIMQYPENFPARDFIINLGLAAKELTLEKKSGNYSLVNLNALPASALPTPINPYRIIVPVVAVAGIAGIIFMWNTWHNTKSNITLLESQLTVTQKAITSNIKDVATLTEQNRVTQAQIKPAIDAANVFNVKMSSITAARTLTNNDVHQIVALNQKEVDMTGMMYSGDSGKTLNGSSATTADILKYAQALRDTGGFTVVVSSISYSPTTTDTGDIIPSYDFSFQMK